MERRLKLFPRSVTPPWPRKVMLELAAVCNHSCVFCAQSKFKKGRPQPPLDFFLRLAEECFRYGSRSISLHGGYEPFASPHLEEVILFCRETGYRKIKATTNGSLSGPARVERCIDNGLTHIQFSVNAGTSETYRRVHGRDHFDRVVGNIINTARYRETSGSPLHIALSFVEVEESAGEFERLSEALRPYVDEFMFYRACNQSGQMPEYDVPTKTASPPCQRPFDRVHITSEGYLSACCGEYENLLAVADLRETDLREAFYGALFQELRRRHLADDLRGTLCFNCIYGADTQPAPLNRGLAAAD